MRAEDRLREQFRRAMTAAEAEVELVEPTEDERRNGWTPESLTEYLREQRAAQSMRIDPAGEMRRQRPRAANSRYRPHRWRG